MSAREVPEQIEPAVFRACGRLFKARAPAYYEIAKRMIGAKYTPELRRFADGRHETFGTALDFADSLGISVMLLQSRLERCIALFFRDDGDHGQAPGYFDTRKWSRFVRRVAKFLAFVDRRRVEIERNPAGKPKRAKADAAVCPGCKTKLKPAQYKMEPDVGSTEAGAQGLGHYASGFCTMRCGWRFAVAAILRHRDPNLLARREEENASLDLRKADGTIAEVLPIVYANEEVHVAP